MYKAGHHPARWLWLSLAWAGVGLGTAGAFLPVLPTTPFLLVSLWAGSKASPRLRFRLYRHPRFGATLRAWHRHGVIPLRVKCLACSLMGVSFFILYLSDVPSLVLASVLALFLATGAFVLTRPSRPSTLSRNSPWQPAP